MPSAASTCIARFTKLREAPYRSASSGSAGRTDPVGYLPSMISSRIFAAMSRNPWRSDVGIYLLLSTVYPLSTHLS